MKNKKGISLIVLVITIFVIIILSGAVIISLNNSGVIEKTKIAKDETRGSHVQQEVEIWKIEMQASMTTGKKVKTTTELVQYLNSKGMLTEDEKDIILGNKEKDIKAQYEIQIGSRKIDFSSDKFRVAGPGIYAEKSNDLLYSWDELTTGNDPYITVSNGVITACKKDYEGDLVIAKGITEIESSAFLGYIKLTNVNFPNTLKEIGQHAFSYCTGLTSITLSTGLETIGGAAFLSCTNLKEIRVQSSPSMGYRAFALCTGVERIIYEEGITNIVGIGATSTRSISLPSTAITIDNSAFSYYSNLTEITIPNSVKTINSNAFLNCTGLTSITLPNELETIGGAAFLSCTNLKEIRVQSSPSIGYRAFDLCTGVERIIYEEGITNIVGIGATSTRSISLPSTAIIIEDSAFSNYSNLIEVTIPNSVKTISSFAFSNCTSLTTITLSRELETTGSAALMNCSSLKEIRVLSSSFTIGYRCVEGCTAVERIIYEEGVTNLVKIGVTSVTSINIPSTVTSIDNNAFSSYTNLTEININKSANSISGSPWGASSQDIVHWNNS